MDLYRVDLAAVVNKYIGETEKNLHRVLSRAEALDVVLLLDEGDALLGSRTEVQSANDRYANLETNYLLQRLETYQGIVVVTTNLGEQHRPGLPAADGRGGAVLPAAAPRSAGAILRPPPAARSRGRAGVRSSGRRRCALTGGQIRNAALHATLLALDDGGGAGDDRAPGGGGAQRVPQGRAPPTRWRATASATAAKASRRSSPRSARADGGCDGRP